MVHFKCRSSFYPLTEIKRLCLKDSEVPWNVKLSYNPPEYNSPILLNKPWADPPIEDENFHPNFNNIDGNINRVSYTANYEIKNKRPLNPCGRTGLQGRGILGKWGPNHAADPIVTRWKIVNENKEVNPISNRPILQFCAIQRRDCNEWALPGGMVDPGENVNETLKREFLEEAFNNLEASSEEAKQNEEMVLHFFKSGKEIYKGYVDDPRNTDNSWMETVAINFHDDNGEHVGKFNLKAGDDAKNIKWMSIDKNLNLYASHKDFLEKVADLHKAHW